MDTSKTRVPLQGAAKIFEAGLKSKTWDIHGMPQFITTTHREGCDIVKSLLNRVLNNILKVKSVGGDNGGDDGVQSRGDLASTYVLRPSSRPVPNFWS